jgi:REP element-mobilizing transposase RayT
MLYHRRLPHWHPQDKGIFLTWHLKGSLPRNRFPPPSCPTHGQAFVWLDRFLDATLSGPRWLAMQEIARLVAESIVFGQQRLQQYELGAWAVMPNHVHLLLFPHVPIPIITRRLKGYTARQANLFLRRTGEPFWQKESYDHWVRNEQEWARIAKYIEENPVQAGLAKSPEEYRWSSAGWTSRREKSLSP